LLFFLRHSVNCKLLRSKVKQKKKKPKIALDMMKFSKTKEFFIFKDITVN